MPPPNEHQILTSYLLHPSPLPTILPYPSFQSLFPSATSRAHTDIKPFYRNLQSQRDDTLDDIRRRIQDECRRSTSLTTRLARQIKKEEQSIPNSRKRKRSATMTDDDHDRQDTSGVESDIEEENTHRRNDNDRDDDTDIETSNHVDVNLDTRLHGPHGSTIPSTTTRQNHSSTSLLDAMKKATTDLEDEISSLEAQIATVQAQCKETLGNLSDLRYGRFSQTRMSGHQSGVGGQNEGTSTSQQQGIEREVVDALTEFNARLQTA